MPLTQELYLPTYFQVVPKTYEIPIFPRQFVRRGRAFCKRRATVVLETLKTINFSSTKTVRDFFFFPRIHRFVLKFYPSNRRTYVIFERRRETQIAFLFDFGNDIFQRFFDAFLMDFITFHLFARRGRIVIELQSYCSLLKSRDRRKN